MSKQLIHIHAKCDKFEIFEIKPANKAVQRLIKIRDLFTGLKYAGNLVVKTVVINPELNLR